MKLLAKVTLGLSALLSIVAGFVFWAIDDLDEGDNEDDLLPDRFGQPIPY